MPHEICKAFSNAGYPLRSTLAQMLDDHFSHCTDRRGCGFTQATRFLSSFINLPAEATNTADLSVFANWPNNTIAEISKQTIAAGWQHGWRMLHLAPLEITKPLAKQDLIGKLKALIPTIQDIKKSMTQPESLLFLSLLEDLLTRQNVTAPEVAGMPLKPEIGSCSQAEEFFLEIAHNRVRRGGSVNVIVSDTGSPLMVEKINLGESHSAIVVAPVNIFGILIPPGSLCALQYSESLKTENVTKHGQIISLSSIDQARFLRLTTLAVDPKDRQRTFTAQIEAQVRAQMLSPLTTTIDQLYEFAANELTDARS